MCGQRCDLCIHDEKLDEQLRTAIEPYLVKIWGNTDWSMRCVGCYGDDCRCRNDPCNAKGCIVKRKLPECKECEEYPCIKATSADYRSMIHTEVHDADEITWGILPYVPNQYENI